MIKNTNIEHGVVCRLENERFGYFAWPTVTMMEDGMIIVASSGLRYYHVCAWGKTVLNYSSDNGCTWSAPDIINDTPLDDRDAGIISLGGKKLLISWFSTDASKADEWLKDRLSEKEHKEIMEVALSNNEETIRKWFGSWIRKRDDDGLWSDPVRVSVTAPHGPILLSNGEIFYLGMKMWQLQDDNKTMSKGSIKAIKSFDGGETWVDMGDIPTDDDACNYHEPHVVELPSGKLIGLIRYQKPRKKKNNIIGMKFDDFYIYQTESEDGGKTWTKAHPTGVYGSPPHVIRHSSGALVCVYGYRKEPYGIRAMISDDEGKTWNSDIVLRDDGINTDLGYPASIELKDGSIFTVYYQKLVGDKQASILWTRWRID